jgi:hypothetical protein
MVEIHKEDGANNNKGVSILSASTSNGKQEPGFDHATGFLQEKSEYIVGE